MNDLRAILLPYCLDRQPDGSYVALNRNYHPVGFPNDREWVTYEDHPVAFRFLRKPRTATIRALSFNGDDNPKAIYLYADGCIPIFGTKDATDAYFNRLARLARLTVRTSRTDPEEWERERIRATIESMQGTACAPIRDALCRVLEAVDAAMKRKGRRITVDPRLGEQATLAQARDKVGTLWTEVVSRWPRGPVRAAMDATYALAKAPDWC